MRLSEKFYPVFFCERRIIADQRPFLGEERPRKDSINKGNDIYQTLVRDTVRYLLFAVRHTQQTLYPTPLKLYTFLNPIPPSSYSPFSSLQPLNPSTSRPFSTYLSYSIYPIPPFIPFPYSSFLNAVSINQ